MDRDPGDSENSIVPPTTIDGEEAVPEPEGETGHPNIDDEPESFIEDTTEDLRSSRVVQWSQEVDRELGAFENPVVAPTTIDGEEAAADDFDDEFDGDKRVTKLEEQLRILQEQFKERERTNHERYRRTLRRIQTERNVLKNELEENKSWMMGELVLEFGLGVIGWSPPLFVDTQVALKRLSGRRRSVVVPEPNHNDDQRRGSILTKYLTVSSGGAGGALARCSGRVWKYLRVPFFVFISIVDFTDAMLDIAVSINDIMDPEDAIKGWSLFLFTMTTFARTLAGMFGMVYSRIEDESDRVVSYFVVELTVLLIQDFAAYAYITIKRYKVGEIDKIDVASLYITFLCATIFVIATFWHFRIIAKQLPPYTSWFYAIMYTFIGTYPIIRQFIMKNRGLEDNLETAFRVMYCTLMPLQLFVMYRWSQYLYNKMMREKLAVQQIEETEEFLINFEDREELERLYDEDENDETEDYSVVAPSVDTIQKLFDESMDRVIGAL